MSRREDDFILVWKGPWNIMLSGENQGTEWCQRERRERTAELVSFLVL
jgi:hypothetical protein